MNHNFVIITPRGKVVPNFAGVIIQCESWEQVWNTPPNRRFFLDNIIVSSGGDGRTVRTNGKLHQLTKYYSCQLELVEV